MAKMQFILGLFLVTAVHSHALWAQLVRENTAPQPQVSARPDWQNSASAQTPTGKKRLFQEVQLTGEDSWIDTSMDIQAGEHVLITATGKLRYADAKDDITTINQMNLPVNKPVIVHLSSKDVIHSFGLPQMRVKQDAIPGIIQNVWFTPTKTGEWEIACSQLCGLGHYRMRGFYTIQTQADFDAWLASQPAGL